MGGIETLPVFLIVFMISGSVHEFAHAWAAWKLGDDTARLEGRLTLDPRAHVDPLGLFVLAASSLAGFGFGWMKPVPVNTYALANPKRDLMWIAAAGPISNMLQALLLMIVAISLRIPLSMDPGLPVFFTIAIMLNLILAAFNLIPLNPLDGYKVLTGILPSPHNYRYEHWASRWGALVLVLIFVVPQVSAVVLGPIFFVVQTAIFGLAGLLTGTM